MKKPILLLGLTAILTLSGPAVYACSCGQITGSIVLPDNQKPKPDPEGFKKWSAEQTQYAFFIGVVVKIERVMVRPNDGSDDRFPMQRVQVRVEKHWLGVKAMEMTIFTGVGGGDCGVPYKKGKEYLFLATRDRDSGLLETDICSPTKVDHLVVNNFNEIFGTAREFPGLRKK